MSRKCIYTLLSAFLLVTTHSMSEPRVTSSMDWPQTSDPDGEVAQFGRRAWLSNSFRCIDEVNTKLCAATVYGAAFGLASEFDAFVGALGGIASNYLQAVLPDPMVWSFCTCQPAVIEWFEWIQELDAYRHYRQSYRDCLYDLMSSPCASSSVQCCTRPNPSPSGGPIIWGDLGYECE
jgi:hypothetical protein